MRKKELMAMTASELCELVNDDFYMCNFGTNPTKAIMQGSLTLNDSIIEIAFYLDDKDIDDSDVYELNNLAYIKLDDVYLKQQ